MHNAQAKLGALRIFPGRAVSLNWFLDAILIHGKFIENLEKLGEVVRQEGPLDEKTSQLIQLAAAAAIRSEGSVHSHVRRARAAGSQP